MDKLLKFLIVVFIGSFFVSCGVGGHFSNKDATRIIAGHFKYPAAVSMRIVFREEGGEMLHHLKEEGYIDASPIQTCCGDFFPTTEKGKPYFGETIKQFSNGHLCLDCRYAKKVIKSIKEIQIDKKTDSAIVEYVEGLEPNEPVYSTIFKKSREGTEKIDLSETHTIRVHLKYYDKSWRVQEKL
jgi:hypothetical protein